jgi:hypothetical protein
LGAVGKPVIDVTGLASTIVIRDEKGVRITRRRRDIRRIGQREQ